MRQTLLLSVLFLLLPMLASAETVMIDGIRYNLISKGNVAEVTSNSYNGDVSIPPSFLYDGVEYRVTSIGENAFANTSGLGSVTLPNTVSVIRSYAFRGIRRHLPSQRLCHERGL